MLDNTVNRFSLNNYLAKFIYFANTDKLQILIVTLTNDIKNTTS